MSKLADDTGDFLTEPPPFQDTITLEIYYGVSSPWACIGAPRIREIADKYGLTIHLKPIVVIDDNGGIRLKTRHPARQAYHALDLYRVSRFHNIPIIASPKYYPQKPGTIEIPAQAIIRVQNHYGVGSKQALEFSYEIQKCIWITEEGDHTDVEVLKRIARRCGIEEDVIQKCVVDRRGDRSDEGVVGWERNMEEAKQLGIFGTPNYVVNGEIFWGQDRLDYVEMRINELLEAGAKPKRFS